MELTSPSMSCSMWLSSEASLLLSPNGGPEATRSTGPGSSHVSSQPGRHTNIAKLPPAMVSSTRALSDTPRIQGPRFNHHFPSSILQGSAWPLSSTNPQHPCTHVMRTLLLLLLPRLPALRCASSCCSEGYTPNLLPAAIPRAPCPRLREALAWGGEAVRQR
jgi:hypothetical protein